MIAEEVFVTRLNSSKIYSTISISWRSKGNQQRHTGRSFILIKEDMICWVHRNGRHLKQQRSLVVIFWSFILRGSVQFWIGQDSCTILLQWLIWRPSSQSNLRYMGLPGRNQ